MASILDDRMPVAPQVTARTIPKSFESLDALLQFARQISEDGQLSSEDKFGLMWAAFELHAREPEVAQLFIDSLEDIPVAQRAPVIKMIEARLAGRLDADNVERALVRLIATQYQANEGKTTAEDASFGENPAVLAALRRATQSERDAVAYQAVSESTRLAPFPDAVAALHVGSTRNLLDAEEFARESALLLASAPDGAAQHQLLQGLLDPAIPGATGASALALVAQWPTALESITPDVLRRMDQAISRHPPAFEVTDVLDLAAMSEYGQWATARANIRHQLDGTAPAQTIAALISAPGADPRAVLAAMLYSSGTEAAQVLALGGKLDLARERLEQVAREAPNAPDIREAVDEARAQLDEAAMLPRQGPG
jgi:hypothetical protein